MCLQYTKIHSVNCLICLGGQAADGTAEDVLALADGPTASPASQTSGGTQSNMATFERLLTSISAADRHRSFAQRTMGKDSGLAPLNNLDLEMLKTRFMAVPSAAFSPRSPSRSQQTSQLHA